MILDAKQREHALNPSESFIVQAPAGSGKTELLTQRFLMLLSLVKKPEEILSITFTKKAAAEMRTRIYLALSYAHDNPTAPTSAHAKRTWQLATAALARDKAMGWHIINNPNRLRVQTIDAFNASLTRQLPILSHFGAMPTITEQATPLYQEAVREFIAHLDTDVAWSDAIAHLLTHMDNDMSRVEALLIKMLARRDQWLPFITLTANDPQLQKKMEQHLSAITCDALAKIELYFPPQLATELLTLLQFSATNLNANQADPNNDFCLNWQLLSYKMADKSAWLTIISLLLTSEFTWRKRVDKNLGFPAASSATNSAEKLLYQTMKQRMEGLIEQLYDYEELRNSLEDLSRAPDCQYQLSQWQFLQALHTVLLVVAAQLTVTFRARGQIDYVENSLAALMALGTDEAPTDLALALDYQLQHILIDEFQDTSTSQYHLVEKLTLGWSGEDNRTLFIVGDPMQSIYRFREAEVGLFIRARLHGIGQMKLTPLTLMVNFRSLPGIVDWVNTHFQQVMPPFEDIATGAISYSPATAHHPDNHQQAVTLHTFIDAAPNAQAEQIVQIIQQTQEQKQQQTIVILVRSRSHLEEIIPALNKAQLTYRAIDIDPLASRPAIQDLLALTRALLHLADRIAWLAILRAPWCGLTLADLLLLTSLAPHHLIFTQLLSTEVRSQLSSDGQQRLARIVPIVQAALAEQRRHSLRLWLESTWLALGGPATVSQADLINAHAFFNLVETLEQGGDLTDLTRLDEAVRRLYAAADPDADGSLQIMTMHNAKGLEFDVVILPHLERKAPSDDNPLLVWMERSREQDSQLILAPIHAVGQTPDPIYTYIKRQHARKDDYEDGRLLYVAVTRAKQKLHLLATLKSSTAQHAEFESLNNSLLNKIWPSLKKDLLLATTPYQPNIDLEQAPLRTFKRLTSSWTNPLTINPAPFAYHQQCAGFRFTDSHPRLIGTLIHRLLQLISEHSPVWWQAQALAAQQKYLEKHLLQLGVVKEQISNACAQVQKAINNTLSDPRGQWLLQAHTEARSEFAITTVSQGKPVNLIVDRTFIDETGLRWIIDYKTTSFTQNTLTEFLLAEQAQHQKQLAHYHAALQQLDARPIRIGLYYPLLPAWHEWEI